MTSEAIKELVPDNQLGCLIAFTTENDPHSPVMAERYDAFFLKASRAGIPHCRLNAREHASSLKSLLVFSVPTLLWVRRKDDDLEILMRIVGIVNEKKLDVELDKAIDRVFAAEVDDDDT